MTAREQSISDRMREIRGLPDDAWTKSVASLATDIRQLPASPGKAVLIGTLSHLVTEGDAGRDTLHLVASAMAQLPRDSPDSFIANTLAQLVRYEHLNVSVDNASSRAAMAKVKEEDRRRASPEFTLSDLVGEKWSLQNLRGKVVPFIAQHKYTYPILLDPGRKVTQLFSVEGIPGSFLYGRNGKLPAQAIDRRTERQFLQMLNLAGLN